MAKWHTRCAQNALSSGTCGFDSHPPHVRTLTERRVVAHLAAGGLNAGTIAAIADVPRSTVRDWLRQPNPRQRSAPALDIDALPGSAYAYLLGLYLGDGTISRGRRGVFRLRIVMDARYPGIIAECATAMQTVLPTNRVGIRRHGHGAVEVSAYSKKLCLLFPQHGAGPKHARPIVLAPWQQAIVHESPEAFLRGLIHSDGCRVLNRVSGRSYPRYFFTQTSADIKQLFRETCTQLDVHFTEPSARTVSIARSSSVALVDSFVGPKR